MSLLHRHSCAFVSPEDARAFAVDVRARVLTNDPALNLRLALAGAGIALSDDGRSREAVARGELISVLEGFSTPFPGFHLYYPERRQASAPLRALTEHLRAARSPGRRKGRRPRPPVPPAPGAAARA